MEKKKILMVCEAFGGGFIMVLMDTCVIRQKSMQKESKML